MRWEPLAITPFAARRAPAELAGLDRAGRRDVVLAGVMLAVHFGAWISALKLTSVAAATAMVSMQLVFVVLLDRLRGTAIPRTVLVGAALALDGRLRHHGRRLHLVDRGADRRPAGARRGSGGRDLPRRRQPGAAPGVDHVVHRRLLRDLRRRAWRSPLSSRGSSSSGFAATHLDRDHRRHGLRPAAGALGAQPPAVGHDARHHLAAAAARGARCRAAGRHLPRPDPAAGRLRRSRADPRWPGASSCCAARRSRRPSS